MKKDGRKDSLGRYASTVASRYHLCTHFDIVWWSHRSGRRKRRAILMPLNRWSWEKIQETMVIEDDDQDCTKSLLIKLLPHAAPRWHWWWWRWCWRLWWCWLWCPPLGKSIPMGSILTI